MRRPVLFLTSISLALAASLASLSPALAMVVPFNSTFIIVEPGGVALFGGGLIVFGGLVALRRWRAGRRAGRQRRGWPFRWPAIRSRRSFDPAARR
jgi:hypothetical protein